MPTMVQQVQGVRDVLAGGVAKWHGIPPAAATDGRVISVCLLEEERVYRAGCEHYLGTMPRIALRVSDAFPDSRQALALVLAEQPDVLMLGVTHLDQEAIGLIKDVQRSAPETGIVLCFTHASDAAVFALRDVSRPGGAGFAFLPRHSVESATHLMQLIEAVAAGRIILDPGVMDRMLSLVGRGSTFLDKLSRRESEVLGMISRGMSNQDIAAALFLERKTVERHINGIYGKLAGEDLSGHARVKAVLAYLTASGRMAHAA